MKLEDINKKDFFKAPEDYFDNFDEQLRKKIESKKERLFWLPKSTFYKLATVTTVFALAIISFFYFQPNTKTKINPTAQNDISQKQIINYLANTDISLDEIANYMQENNIDIYNSQDSTKTNQSDSLNASDIENYLINNGIDEQTIINSL